MSGNFIIIYIIKYVRQNIYKCVCSCKFTLPVVLYFLFFFYIWTHRLCYWLFPQSSTGVIFLYVSFLCIPRGAATQSIWLILNTDYWVVAIFQEMHVHVTRISMFQMFSQWGMFPAASILFRQYHHLCIYSKVSL